MLLLHIAVVSVPGDEEEMNEESDLHCIWPKNWFTMILCNTPVSGEAKANVVFV